MCTHTHTLHRTHPHTHTHTHTHTYTHTPACTVQTYMLIPNAHSQLIPPLLHANTRPTTCRIALKPLTLASTLFKPGMPTGNSLDHRRPHQGTRGERTVRDKQHITSHTTDIHTHTHIWPAAKIFVVRANWQLREGRIDGRICSAPHTAGEPPHPDRRALRRCSGVRTRE
jgi:hypothetical protein